MRPLQSMVALILAAAGVGADTGEYRNLGYMYLSPLPGAEYTATQTKFVLVRFTDVAPSALTNLSQFIQVSGASSGNHPGQAKIASDKRTVIFEMSSNFLANELVTVNLAPQLALGTVQPYQYQFMISGHMPDPIGAPPRESNPLEQPDQDTSAPSPIIPAPAPAPPAPAPPLGPAPAPASPGKSGIMSNGVSVPSDFPHINITTHDNPDSGLIFMNNHSVGQRYNVIFDNSGAPVWYMRTADQRLDMKVQPNGMLTMATHIGGTHFIGLNHHYEEVASYRTVNGYSVDEHELLILEDGTYFLIGAHFETVDLSRYISGGNTSAVLAENCIQQFTPAGELIFQWRAWDHLDVAGQLNIVPVTNPGDFPHMNAIAVDTDGHLLLSSRYTSEVTKINSDTGEMIWRLGGSHNQFTYVNDPLNGPSCQHAIRPLGNNRYTLFDNGNGHRPWASRAVEYELNPDTLTATVVWQYPATPTTSLFAHYMGNAQRLPNGNTLVNWVIGNLPKLTEVRPDGTKAFEMNWVNGYETYRVWRCPWQGVALRPYLILEAYPDNVTLLFNQFGDTNIASYRIYGGPSPQPTTLLTTSLTTMQQLTNLPKGQRYYFRVAAVDQLGVEGAFSNEDSVVVNSIKPGQNMVANGDFSGGTTAWSTELAGTAAMTWTVSGGYSSSEITNGGTATSQIQLRQTGIPLVLGNKYVLEFDAWSTGPRTIEAKVTSANNTSNYGIMTSAISPVRKRLRSVFTMSAFSDFNSRVVFNMGTSTRPVYLDNISLFNPPPGDFNMDGRVDLLDLKVLTGEWRKQQSGLSSDLDADGKVEFKDFGLVGDSWSGSP